MPAVLEMTLDQLPGFLAAEAARLREPDLTDAMQACALAARAAILDNFQGQHGPDGAAWAPLKRARNRKRDRRAAKKGGVQAILQDTGLLMASYQSGANHTESIDRESMVTGSNLDRAAWQNFGTRTIPARPQAGWNEDLISVCSDIVADRLLQIAAS